MAADRLPRPSWADLSTRAGLSAAQRRVLEAVESASEPQTTVQLARALNLHHNTVREHLDALASAGFVATSTRPTGPASPADPAGADSPGGPAGPTAPTGPVPTPR